MTPQQRQHAAKRLNESRQRLMTELSQQRTALLAHVKRRCLARLKKRDIHARIDEVLAGSRIILIPIYTGEATPEKFLDALFTLREQFQLAGVEFSDAVNYNAVVNKAVDDALDKLILGTEVPNLETLFQGLRAQLGLVDAS